MLAMSKVGAITDENQTVAERIFMIVFQAK
jgi:hypothetical protein